MPFCSWLKTDNKSIPKSVDLYSHHKLTLKSMSFNIHIEEIRPSTLNKVIFSDDLCKLSFNIFSNDTLIEILYNPKRNMFNATALINKVGVDPRRLKTLMRSADFMRFVDRISYLLFGHYHYLYQGESIWNNDKTIKSELLDVKSNIIRSKLEETEDNVIETILNGPNTTRGTWFHYEFLPRILRYINEDYEILANHYESTLLPYLTNHKVSFEQEVIQKQYQCLIEQDILDEIDKEQKPVFKGSKTEKYCAELFKKVFETDSDYEDVSIVSHEKHTCDIQLKRERLLVEVKMVKNSPRPGDDKFIRDLKENANSIAAGVYINFGNNTMPTHIEFNPFRIYLNRKDFNESFLTFIRESFSNHDIPSIAEQMKTSSQQNESSQQLAINTEISSSIIRKGTLYFSDALLAIISNLKADARLSQYINKTDITDRESMLQQIQRGEDMNDFDKYTKEFLAIHLKEFEKGMVQDVAKMLFEEYLISKGMDSMKDSDIVHTLNCYAKLMRPSVVGRQRKYKIRKGMLDEIRQIDISKIDTNNLITLEEAVSKGLTSPEQAIKDFLQLPRVKEFTSNPSGFTSNSISMNFREYIHTQIQPEKYNITLSRFAQYFYKYMSENYVQISGKTNKNRYFTFDNPIAIQSLKEFDECVENALAQNKNITYTSMIKAYDKLETMTPKLTKTTSMPRFAELKKSMQAQSIKTN